MAPTSCSLWQKLTLVSALKNFCTWSPRQIRAKDLLIEMEVYNVDAYLISIQFTFVRVLIKVQTQRPNG